MSFIGFQRINIYLLVVFLSLHVFICCRLTTNFPTVDEIGHLPAGVSHWRFGSFDLYRVNPPLVRMVCCLFAKNVDEFDWSIYKSGVGERAEFDIGLNLLSRVGLSIVSLYIIPRTIAIGFSLLGVIAGFQWLRILFPQSWCAIIFVALWSFSPMFLAHAPTLGPDVAAASFGLCLAYSWWKFSINPTLNNALLGGLWLGGSLLTKLTWLTAYASIPFALLFSYLLSNHDEKQPIAKLLRGWLIGVPVSCLVLNSGYFFEGAFDPLSEYTFCSQTFGGDGASRDHPDSRVAIDSELSGLPVPFPRNFILGIDYLKSEVEMKMWSFLNGEWRFGSWFYYYFCTVLYKTPESTLFGALLGFLLLVFSSFRHTIDKDSVAAFVFLIFSSGFCFFSISYQGGFNHHHRYVSIVYPLLFFLVAFLASPAGINQLKVRLFFLRFRCFRFAVPLAFLLVFLSAISALRIHPYYTSYFNTVSGGPGNGWRLLGFSNIDWGQDILEVDRWLRDHPERRPVIMDLDYFELNGELFDLSTDLPPKLPSNSSISTVQNRIVETQWWIISVKRLYNHPKQAGLEYLQQLEPVERIAYSYLVYRIDPAHSHEH